MITRENALLVLRKLHDDGSVVICLGTLWGWNVMLKGRILALSEAELSLVSLDSEASLTLRLDLDDEVFEYREPKDLPIARVPESAKDAAGLCVGLPLRFSAAQLSGPLEQPIREKLVLVELRE